MQNRLGLSVCFVSSSLSWFFGFQRYIKQVASFFVAVCFTSMVNETQGQVFPGNASFDRYGGYLAIEGTATGRFHLEKLDGRHFLITPDGYGFLSFGVTHTRALADPGDSGYDYFLQAHGRDWSKANAKLQKSFQQWGYNSLGYDSHPSTRKLYPHFASCSPSGKVSSWLGRSISFPDVFSSEWKARARSELEDMWRRYGGDPNLIGIYWTDMPAWDLESAERRAGRTWVDAIRNLPETAPGKFRYNQFLLERGAEASDEEFLRIIAREVYAFIGPLTRELAPDTLIFGDRYSGKNFPWTVAAEALRWIDVISVQPDDAEYPADLLNRVHRETGKPVMICDHQSSFATSDHQNVMWKTLSDVSEVTRSHGTYLEQGFATSFLIGYSRCQYIDRYQSQRDILKQGLVKANGKPYEELVEGVRKNNWAVHGHFVASAAAAINERGVSGESGEPIRHQYGTEDRQWLLHYPSSNGEPSPVYFYAHARGNNPRQAEKFVDDLLSCGVSVISWNSIRDIQTLDQVRKSWEDAETAFQWVINNADELGLNPRYVVIGGTSRGSVISWPLAHSGHPAIRGICMQEALPIKAWQLPNVWLPTENVNKHSPPMQLTYFRVPGVSDLPERHRAFDNHDPKFGQRIADRYAQEGIRERAEVVHSLSKRKRPYSAIWQGIGEFVLGLQPQL